MASEQWLVIGINGITNGGKTTLANSLYNYFRSKIGDEIKTGIELNRVELMNQDNYFRSVNDPNHVKIEKLNHLNWEIIESIDTDRMIDDIMKTLGNNFVLYSTSSSTSLEHENLFSDHYSNSSIKNFNDDLMIDIEDQMSFKHVKHNSLLNILIIEGFLVFNHPVTFDICNIRFHIHVPYEVCYSRRLNRIYDPPDVPTYFEMVVWPEYEKNLKYFKDRKDVMYLNGEVAPDKILNFVLYTIKDQL
jgi:nicotinamide/nicotinate riboside kinase